jgi:4-hydroxy-tetrahydrodipicolinate synthase
MKAVFEPVGVMPACLMPLQSDGKIDEANYRRHLRDLANVKGLTGIVVNGHAAEVHALTLEQQIWGIATACEEVGNQIPIIAGVYAEATHFARDMANAAEKAGAQAILIFPPNSLMFGGNARPELGAQFVRDVATATSLPAILFQFPLTTSLSYDFDTIVRLCDEVENIVAIKELGSEPRIHERTIEALHGLSKPVNVLTSQSQWLGASLSMGARGIISGAGSVIADRQRALFDAFVSESPNPKFQRELLAEMSLLVDAFYGAPYVNWQARMKQVLFHFKRFATPNVFAPLQTISQDDWQRIVALLDKAGLTADTLYRK